MASNIPSDLTCAICKDLLSEDCQLMDSCEHVFCRNCINPVLVTSKQCPSCRRTIRGVRKPMFQFLNAIKAFKKKTTTRSTAISKLSHSLNQINLWANDTKLDSVAGNGSQFQVFIRDLNGKNRAVTVRTYESVRALKRKVAEVTGVPSEIQRLLFGGKQLADGEMLSKYNLEHGSTVHLVLRLLGGVN